MFSERKRERALQVMVRKLVQWCSEFSQILQRNFITHDYSKLQCLYCVAKKKGGGGIGISKTIDEKGNCYTQALNYCAESSKSGHMFSAQGFRALAINVDELCS